MEAEDAAVVDDAPVVGQAPVDDVESLGIPAFEVAADLPRDIQDEPVGVQDEPLGAATVDSPADGAAAADGQMLKKRRRRRGGRRRREQPGIAAEPPGSEAPGLE